MKRMRSLGLVLITAGLLSTTGPTWAAGSSTQRSPVDPGISTAILGTFGSLWDSILAGFQAILGEDVDGAKADTVTDPPSDTDGGTGPLYPGGGCIDPNGVPVNVYPCPY